MDNLTATILAHIDYGSLILIALAVGFGMFAYQILVLIFTGVHEALDASAGDEDDSNEDDAK